MSRLLLKNMTDEQCDPIIKYYISGKTTYETADEFSVSQGLVVKILKKYDITARKAYSYYHNDRLNYNFFDKIDTEAKAYFLGLMFADGNNYRKQRGNSSFYEVSINLQEGDKHILECFRSYIAPNGGYDLNLLNKKKYNIKHQNQYRLRFADKTISDQLVHLGCVPAKSLILEYPTEHIPKDLENHFIRGYFDGDGCITSSVPKKSIRPQFKVKVVSTYDFCKNINNKIENHIKLSMELMSDTPKYATIWVSRVGGNHQVYRLMSWLYKDATIFLKRKHDKFLELEKLINDDEEVER